MKEKRKSIRIQDLTQRESVNPFLKEREKKIWDTFAKKFEKVKAERVLKNKEIKK
jgi:hypothetical protein